MHKYYFIGLIALLIGCQSIEKKVKPTTLLSEDEMVNALTELAILKASITVAPGVKNNSGIDFKEYIAQKINVDSTVMSENIAFYGYRPEKLKDIYLRVEDSLEIRFQLHDSLMKKYRKESADPGLSGKYQTREED